MLISTERYMAVCAPLTAYRIGRRRLRYAVVVIVAASVAFNVPRFFEFRPTTVSFTPPSGPPSPTTMTMIVLEDTWLRYDEVYQYVYNTAIYVYDRVGLFDITMICNRLACS